MRITLPSGASAEIAATDTTPVMGLVIAPDIFGLRPLYDGLVARLAAEWSMAVCAVEPFPGRDLPGDNLVDRRADDLVELAFVDRIAALRREHQVGHRL